MKSTWVMAEKEPVIPIQSTLILSALDCPAVSWKVVLKKPMHHWNLNFDGGRQQLTLLSCTAVFRCFPPVARHMRVKRQ